MAEVIEPDDRYPERRPPRGPGHRGIEMSRQTGRPAIPTEEDKAIERTRMA